MNGLLAYENGFARDRLQGHSRRAENLDLRNRLCAKTPVGGDRGLVFELAGFDGLQFQVRRERCARFDRANVVGQVGSRFMFESGRDDILQFDVNRVPRAVVLHAKLHHNGLAGSHPARGFDGQMQR